MYLLIYLAVTIPVSFSSVCCCDPVSPDLVSYSTTISAYAKVGQPDEANAVFNRMLRRGIAPDTMLLNALLGAHCIYLSYMYIYICKYAYIYINI